MPTDTKSDVTERMNALAVDATQTFIDAAYLAQRQSAQLLQAWLNTLDAGQKEQREIASQLIKQTKEAQELLQQYVQESSRAGAEVFTKSTQKA
jgi:BMFP domain-containing protein YqiC